MLSSLILGSNKKVTNRISTRISSEKKNCLFGTVKIVRNVIKSKFTFDGQGVAFVEEGS